MPIGSIGGPHPADGQEVFNPGFEFLNNSNILDNSARHGSPGGLLFFPIDSGMYNVSKNESAGGCFSIRSKMTLFRLSP
jgi:hypothetical protein